MLSPRSLTHAIMHTVKRRILRYALENNTLPENLEILLDMPSHIIRIKDAWSRKLIYNANPDKTITLISYGKDGIKGGKGENKDMLGIFPFKNADGEWQDDTCDWIKNPLN